MNCRTPKIEIDVTDHDAKVALKKRTGWRTIPQIFIGEKMIGGYQKLVELERKGELEPFIPSPL